MSGKPPTDQDERTLGPDEERGRSVIPRQYLISFTRPLLDVGSWPLATNFSFAPGVRFRGEAEVGRTAGYAASVANNPQQTW